MRAVHRPSSAFFTDVHRILAAARRDPRRTCLVCLERSLFTTRKWNLKHFLDNHFNAF